MTQKSKRQKLAPRRFWRQAIFAGAFCLALPAVAGAASAAAPTADSPAPAIAPAATPRIKKTFPAPGRAAPAAPHASAAADAGNRLRAIHLLPAAASGETRLRFIMQRPFAELPKSFALAEPARVALDFSATTAALGDAPLPANQGALQRLRFGQTPERLRVVLDLQQAQKHALRLEGRQLDLTLTPLTAENPAPAAAAKPAARRIDRITACSAADGSAHLALALSDGDNTFLLHEAAGEVVIELPATALPPALRGSWLTAEGAGGVAYRTEQSGATARLRVALPPAGGLGYRAYQLGRQLNLVIAPQAGKQALRAACVPQPPGVTQNQLR